MARALSRGATARLRPLRRREAQLSPEQRGREHSSKFAERCQPTQIIDIMWHAHLLSPRAYAASGLSLIGSIIDHDPGYYNLHEAEHASKLVPKVKKVFTYEMRHLDERGDYLDWISVINNSLKDFAMDICESMNDPGCG